MLEIRSAPLPPDVEYFLDGATETCEIDGASSFVLRVYGERKTIIDIVDRDEAIPGLAARRHTGQCLMDYAEALMAEMSTEQRGACAAMGIAHLRHEIPSLAAVLAEWAMGDLVEGGHLEAWNKPPRAQRDGFTPLRRDLRRLHSPRWVKRYVKANDSAQFYRLLGSRVLRRAASVPPSFVRGGSELFEADWQESRRRQRETEQAAWRRIEHQTAMGIEPDYRTAFRDERSIKQPRKVTQKIRKYRKTVRRSIALAEQVVAANQLKAFVAGDAVRLSGQSMDFEVRCRKALGSVASNGHGALDVAVLSPGGPKLADLCMYFEGTPPVDQLVAMKMHLDCGLEGELLDTANVIRMTEEGVAHPILATKREAARAREAALLSGEILPVEMAMPRLWETSRARNKHYFEETKPLWVGSLSVFVLGARYATISG